MGRPAADDPALFQAAAAAGALAAAQLRRRARPMADRLERLVNLTATLLDTRRPLTPRRAGRAASSRATPTTRPRAGASSSATRRRCASSASRSAVEPVDGFGAEQAYRIHPDDYYLPELGAHRRASSPRSTSRSPRCGSRATTAARALRQARRARRGRAPTARSPSSTVTPGLAVLFDAVSRHARR